ncbi:uncharacterized protein [Primulina huaijiensis]|uniref:uncharacterized protein n=1 Tax=Primulina huaijiensis TaxID=1492673 RepID=UPI003CC78117
MEPKGFISHLEKIIRNRSQRERKSALIQDVDDLKKKLRHEENVHRALKRALDRPQGTLPPISTHFPEYILELLAEVAVLEEEVVRLEEQVKFRQHLCKESVRMPSIMCAEDSACFYHESSIATPKRGHSRSLSQNDVKMGSALAWPPPSHSRRSVSYKKTWRTWFPKV